MPPACCMKLPCAASQQEPLAHDSTTSTSLHGMIMHARKHPCQHAVLRAEVYSNAFCWQSLVCTWNDQSQLTPCCKPALHHRHVRILQLVSMEVACHLETTTVSMPRCMGNMQDLGPAYALDLLDCQHGQHPGQHTSALSTSRMDCVVVLPGLRPSVLLIMDSEAHPAHSAQSGSGSCNLDMLLRSRLVTKVHAYSSCRSQAGPQVCPWLCVALWELAVCPQADEAAAVGLCARSG